MYMCLSFFILPLKVTQIHNDECLVIIIKRHIEIVVE